MISFLFNLEVFKQPVSELSIYDLYVCVNLMDGCWFLFLNRSPNLYRSLVLIAPLLIFLATGFSTISSYRFNYEYGRAFIESNLPAYKDSNPQLEVITELSRGQHPCLKAFYKNKNERVVCVKNLASEDVLLHATRLRNALGRKVKKLPTRHVTKHPSVQGTWTTDVRFWSTKTFYITTSRGFSFMKILW